RAGRRRGGTARSPRACPRRRSTTARLVFRAVLARIGVFLRVDPPVRSRPRSVPRASRPVRFEGLVVDTIVGGRSHGRPATGPLASPTGRARPPVPEPEVPTGRRRCGPASVERAAPVAPPGPGGEPPWAGRPDP